MILDSKAVIGDCLETAFDLPGYLVIIRAVRKDRFVATRDFQKKFNAYYRVRQRTDKWYKEYFKLMENQRKDNLSFEEILRQLLPFGSIEASFTSKLIATVDPNRPIWDQYVLSNLNEELYQEWAGSRKLTQEERIRKAVDIYGWIEKEYVIFLHSDEGKKCISAFDAALPRYAKSISDTKKIDFFLVNKRKQTAGFSPEADSNE